MESEKCQQFHNFLRSGWDAEEWYKEFENSVPEVLTLWATLHKHFCVKWLDASPNILLKIPEIHAPSTCIATITPKAIGHEDAPQLLLPPTVNLQPLNYTPIICKPNSIMPNLTQTAAKLPTNKTKPETAVMTTSNMTVDKNAVMSLLIRYAHIPFYFCFSFVSLHRRSTTTHLRSDAIALALTQQSHSLY